MGDKTSLEALILGHVDAQLRAALRDHAAANDDPRWRRLDLEATRRGFPSTRAFRAWCLARQVPLREANQRDAWVCPADVDAAVERMPVVVRKAPDAEEDAAMTQEYRDRLKPSGRRS